MQKTITFRHMEHSKPIENHVHEKLAKIESILEHEREPIYLEVFLEPVKVHACHKVHILVKTPHYYLNAEDEGPHFYQVLDQVIDIMYRQIIEKKRELKDKNKG